LLNEKGESATIQDLAFLLRTSEKKVVFALQVLTNERVRWMYSEGVPEIPGIPGKSGAFLNSTQLNSTQLNTTQHNSTQHNDSRSFDQFWKSYPKKVGKGAARKVWKKIKPNEKLWSKIIASLEIQKLSHQWTKYGGQYIPNPSTWLNEERWEDELRSNKDVRTTNQGNAGQGKSYIR